MTTTRPVDAVPAESSTGHRPGRDCPCGPVAMRDLATGVVSVWRHHRFLPDKEARRVTARRCSCHHPRSDGEGRGYPQEGADAARGTPDALCTRAVPVEAVQARS